MNKGHAALCSSPRWADFISREVLPTALGDQFLGADILEVGPGYGASTARLMSPGRTVTAVEIDSRLAARLRQRFPQLKVVEGSGDDLPFPDSSFSAVVCFTMLHHVHTVGAQDAIFSEACRVLRPGGLFAGSDSIASPGLRAFHHDDTYTPVDPEGLADRLELAGFKAVKVDVSSDHEWFAFSGQAVG